MYWRCSPEEEEGCFYDPKRASHEELDWAIGVALKTNLPSRRNPLPLMLKKNKTIEEKLELLDILEDVEDEEEEMPEPIPFNPFDVEDEDEEMPELIPISAQ